MPVMMEQTPRWQVGQEVTLPRVNPYEIIQLVGPAGNIHISHIGRYHVFWHREKPDGSTILVHHGGPDGFASLRAVMHQHERVILRYTGLVITVPVSQQDEIPAEEKQSGLPIVGTDFPTLASQLEQLRIPGEQQLLHAWIGTLQNFSQELPTVSNHGRLTQIREELDDLLTKKSLIRPTGQYKRSAVASLEGVKTGEISLTAGINEAQLGLLRRAEQTVAITLGTMKRYNDLERLQLSWNGVVGKLPGMSAHLIRLLQRSDLPADRLERAIKTNLLDANVSLAGYLNQLKGEPYFKKAQEFIDNLSPVRKFWEARVTQRMLNVLIQQTQELEIWRRRIKEEHEGVGLGRYNVA